MLIPLVFRVLCCCCSGCCDRRGDGDGEDNEKEYAFAIFIEEKNDNIITATKADSSQYENNNESGRKSLRLITLLTIMGIYNASIY